MIEKKLKSLTELEDNAQLLSELVNSTKNKYDLFNVNQPLFRGQSNSNWNLQSTLERFTNHRYSIKSYNQLLYKLSCSVNSFTDFKWDMVHYESDIFAYGKVQASEIFETPKNYEFLIYSRHHGFPSPLLDWSRSLYVALYFAYANSKDNSQDDIAIFCFIDSLKGGFKSADINSPEIVVLNPFVSTHKRHYMQQAQYTLSVQRKNDMWSYCSYDEVLQNSIGNAQDVVHKFLLPANLKNQILKKLNEMNINAFTLFGNEEGLMESVAFQEITLKQQ